MKKHENSVHTMLAYVFAACVLVDLVFMPLLMAWFGKEWHSHLTENGSGFFISFGAILGVGAWRRILAPALPSIDAK